jgi:hypothetical protein
MERACEWPGFVLALYWRPRVALLSWRASGLAFGFSLFGLGVACDAVTSVAVQGADFGGATADAHCDRRLPLDGGQPSSFCQDVQNTLAASQFSDDCRLHLLATPGTGLCPREGIIAGCKLDKKNDDGSIVHDWYYDVSGLLGAGGADAGADGGSPFADPVPRNVSEVAQVCADRTRYEDGAELAYP